MAWLWFVSFPVYGSSLSRSVSPAALDNTVKGLYDNHGVKAFKIKIAQRMGHNVDGEHTNAPAGGGAAPDRRRVWA
jgi:hypothetical protein